MRKLQATIIKELAVQPSIKPEAEITRRVQFLVNYAIASGASGFVLGISGGQDSTLAGMLTQRAALALRAAGHEASFTAVRLPYRVQRDEADARLAVETIGPDHQLEFNIGESVDALVEEFSGATDEQLSDFNRGNVKARMRMIAQYAIAGDQRLLVVGTDHAAEAVTGFFTKFGDGAADVLPLAGLTKSQGRQLLEHLGAPERLIHKTPTADLLDEVPGQPDAVELGFDYDTIDAYLTGKKIPNAQAEAIEARYLATAHKRQGPVTPLDKWWR